MNKELAVLVGKRIIQVRKLQSVSQEKLATKSGIDRSYVGRIERGEVNITLEKLYELSAALGCHAKDLLP